MNKDMREATPAEQLAHWIDQFNAALAQNNPEAAAALFHDESYWRDCVAFTWNIVTFEGRKDIAAMLRSRMPALAPVRFAAYAQVLVQGGASTGMVTFETAIGRGAGVVRVRDASAGRC